MAEAYAVCTPVPPAPSGIAHFAAVHLPRLAELLPLAVFAPAPHADRLAALPVRPLAQLPGGAWRGVVYHLGNAACHHGEIYRLALRRPGVVVLHELMLQHLIRDLTVHAGRAAEWVQAMAAAYGVGGRRTAQRWLAAGAGGELWERPLFEPLVDASRGVVVHTRWAERRVRAARPEAAVRYVPPPLYPEAPVAPEAVAAARARCGVEEGEPLIGCFGYMTRAKRLEVVLAAFARLRRRRPRARLVFVGDLGPDPGLPALLSGAAGAGVAALGRVDDGAYRALMAAVDVAVNLRHPSGGEASAALLRLLALGVPTVVTDRGPSADLPHGSVAKVAPGACEVEDLAATLLALADLPELARRLGAAGQAWVCREHEPDASTRAYAAAIRELCARPAPPPPPAAPPPGIRSDVTAAIGAALAEVGVREADRGAIAAVAEAAGVIGRPTGR